jgi:hypothetical protein
MDRLESAKNRFLNIIELKNMQYLFVKLFRFNIDVSSVHGADVRMKVIESNSSGTNRVFVFIGVDTCKEIEVDSEKVIHI